MGVRNTESSEDIIVEGFCPRYHYMQYYRLAISLQIGLPALEKRSSYSVMTFPSFKAASWCKSYVQAVSFHSASLTSSTEKSNKSLLSVLNSTCPSCFKMTLYRAKTGVKSDVALHVCPLATGLRNSDKCGQLLPHRILRRYFLHPF